MMITILVRVMFVIMVFIELVDGDLIRLIQGQYIFVKLLKWTDHLM